MRFVAAVVLALVPLGVFADHDRSWGYDAQIAELGLSRIEALPIPVYGVELSDLSKNFGDPRGGGTRSHEGLDIIAPKGTPIASPTEAVVTRTGNGSGSGIYIRTANPGGEQFVYMHLDSIAPGIESGKRVARGEIIGFVGNTGNASGGGAHLHFEIRKNGAIDPFPRLATVFTPGEWETSIGNARAKGIEISLSVPVQSAPAPTPVAAVPQATGSRANLLFNETNGDVMQLQKFLIANPKGSAGERLARTGATGYFGSLTRETLIEYQRFAGITASGMVDDATYALIFELQDEGVIDDEELVTASPNPTSSLLFTRDLELGMENADVRELQKFLNANGFVIAASGAGSPGNETTYFGARTKAALARYQSAKGITPAAGYFGPKTRARVSQL